MEKKEMTLVYYHVPEDKDDPDVPNVFTIPISKQNIKLDHIYQYFPLKGTYTFRFKFTHQGFIVWLDVADHNAKLPLFKDKICIKATRLSWSQSKVSQGLTQSAKISAQNKKQQIDFFDHHENNNKSANQKNEAHQGHQGESLLGAMGQTPIFNQPTPHNGLSFFEAGTSVNSEHKTADPNMIGSFQKHGDLI